MTGSAGPDAYPDLGKLQDTLVRITAIGRLKRDTTDGLPSWRLEVPIDAPAHHARVLWFRGATDLLEAEQIAPAEWPPQPGDVWEDATGQVWFFYLGEHTGELSARNATGGYLNSNPADHLSRDNYMPVKLRHRLGAGEG